MNRAETVAGIAYHIDKTCTGGTEEDFIAAEAIRVEFVDPLEQLRAQLTRENEALHGLLAHACQTLALLAGYTGDNLIAQHHADLALNTLAQIKEGVVP